MSSKTIIFIRNVVQVVLNAHLWRKILKFILQTLKSREPHVFIRPCIIFIEK